MAIATNILRIPSFRPSYLRWSVSKDLLTRLHSPVIQIASLNLSINALLPVSKQGPIPLKHKYSLFTPPGGGKTIRIDGIKRPYEVDIRK